MQHQTAIEALLEQSPSERDAIAIILMGPQKTTQNLIETVLRDQQRKNEGKNNNIDSKTSVILRAAHKVLTLEELKRRITEAIGTISNRQAANAQPQDVLSKLEKRYVALSQGVDRVLAVAGRIHANAQSGHGDEDPNLMEHLLHDDLHHIDHAEHLHAEGALHDAVSELHKFVEVNGHELDGLGMKDEKSAAQEILTGFGRAGYGPHATSQTKI